MPRTRITGVLAVAAAVLLSLGACSTAKSSQDPAPTATLTAADGSASNNGKSLDAAAFAEAMTAKGTTLIDVRTPEEFASGHLKGAVNYDLTGGQFEKVLPTLAKDGNYAIYCQSANRSRAALTLMDQQGFTNAYDLAGGIIAWRNADYPIVK